MGFFDFVKRSQFKIKFAAWGIWVQSVIFVCKQQMKVVDDARPVYRRVVESFLNKFFPSGYPYRLVGTLPFPCWQCKLGNWIYTAGKLYCYMCVFWCFVFCSVNEGYLRYTQFRALQHFSSAALSVLSTQVFFWAYSELLHSDFNFFVLV